MEFPPEQLTCSCCGRGFLNTSAENPLFGEEQQDMEPGRGYCMECLGDPKSKSTRRRLGWAGMAFYQTRFPIVRGRLKPEYQAKWDELPLWKKVVLVARQIEKGAMI